MSQTTDLAEYEDLFTLEQIDSYEKFSELLPTFMGNLDRLLKLHGSDRWRSDAFLIRSELTPLLNETNTLINELIEHQRKEITISQTAAAGLYSQKRLEFFIIGILSVIGIIAIAWLLGRNITMPLQKAVDMAERIAKGRLNNYIDSPNKDETGVLLHTLMKMQDNLRLRIEEEQQIAAENLRIRYALDQVSTCVTVSDDENQLIYLNHAAHSLLDEMIPALTEKNLRFDLNNPLGNRLSDLFTDDKLVEAYRSHLKEPKEYDTELVGYQLHLTANPVLDSDGKYRGRVTQWDDITKQLAVEKEIDMLVESARSGNLTHRISLDGKQGFLLQLGRGFNELLDELSSVFDEVAKAMSEMAKGDLTYIIDKEYQGTFGEVKENVNLTRLNLEQVISELHHSTYMIANASAEISSGNNNLSSRTDQQASSLEETASSMSELTGIVRNNADNALKADKLANSTRHQAEEGGGIVREAVQAMDQINTASNRIAEIIGVIDEIAFQTNLLALNASVEAARAGEQGRGFAVVATEVRNLASRSATAAKEIKDLIHDSGNKVQAGSELVNRSGETLEEIVIGVKKVGDIVAEIASASQEQATGIDQINHSIANMDEMTQQNASLAEETSAASAAMNDKALEMQNRIAFFKLEHEGEAT